MNIRNNDLIMETYCYPKVSWYVVADVDRQNKIVHAKSIIEPTHKSSVKWHYINDLMNMKYKLVIDSNGQERKKREVTECITLNNR